MPNNMLSWNDFYDGLEKRVSSAALLLENENGELLVLKANYKKSWSPPGGIIDAGETPRQCAVRETREETGIDLSVEELEYQAMIVRLGPDVMTYLFVFSASKQVPKNQSVSLDDSEIDEYDWVTASEVRHSGKGRDYNHAIRNWAKEEPLSYFEAMI